MMRDPGAFAQDQNSLAHVWTFLGLTGELARYGGWIAASLATRSVFVERFGDQSSGFENRCAHRFHPLRLAPAGNAPVICSPHHWQYNRDGLAVGTAVCRELYGVPPYQLQGRLVSIEVATCGGLVFGRLPAPHATQSLRDYLGEVFDVPEVNVPDRGHTAAPDADRTRQPAPLYSYLTEQLSRRRRPSHHVWTRRLSVAREFHICSPRAPQRLSREQRSRSPVARTVSRFRTVRSDNTCYSIFQCFPNFLIVRFRSDRDLWFSIIIQYIPLAHDRTERRFWIISMAMTRLRIARRRVWRVIG